jgi:hypothetical protein
VPRVPKSTAPVGAQAIAAADGALEEREVRAADPELSAETNARLTAELRAVVGTDKVRVPKSRPHSGSSPPACEPRFHYRRLINT